jgi:beta-1,4-N-acetylglucosaminyltransferase
MMPQTNIHSDEIDKKFLAMESKKTASKFCFVTIGATASFDGLLKAIFQGPFLDALQDANYTDLLVQYGKDGKAIYDKFTSENAEGVKERCGLNVNGFDFNARGLTQEMRKAKSDTSAAKAEGVVISHAGTNIPFSLHDNGLFICL